ncbi:hypothetical protein J7J18_03720 [bacterium]|nr:hypothetical protein [bacterium]
MIKVCINALPEKKTFIKRLKELFFPKEEWMHIRLKINKERIVCVEEMKNISFITAAVEEVKE